MEVMNGESFTNLERERVTKQGSKIFISMSIAPLVSINNENYGVMAVIADITDQKKSEKRIHDLAFYDHLTSLPNRALFQDRFTSALANAKRDSTKVALLFVDLDRFKTINDSLGHNAGDLLLNEVARRFTSIVKSTDTVSRQGGDEFTLILTDLENEEQAAHTAEKLIEVLSDPLKIENHDVYIGASIGISLYPNDSNDSASLIKYADVAMYSAKRKGGDNYQFYTDDMNARVVERMTVELNLRSALKRDELIVYYQPKVDLSSGKIISAECLVRWNSCELGLVSPARFIPIAEETGLIGMIDEWVLRTACKQNKIWQENGFPENSIAVNVTTKELSKKLILTIKSALKNSGMKSKYLEIEITESGIMEVEESVLSIIDEIKELGVKISVDDFGTGYSSLSRLKDLPIDCLKIDQSFIRNLINDERDAAIVSSIIAIGHNLGLKVIAEGVENEQTAKFLREEKCDEFQGYLASPPLPGDQFIEYLSKLNSGI
jgi:diguanylate cyclase (GGDEF)-like protein